MSRNFSATGRAARFLARFSRENMEKVIENYNSFLSGDKNALCDIVREYSDRAVCFAYCIVSDYAAAEDAVSDAFAALLYKKPRIVSAAAFKSYLYKTVRNKAYDHLRRQKKLVRCDGLEEILKGDAERDMFEREERKKLYVCMQELPAQYRDVLSLVYFDGFAADEACAITGKSKKQLYNLLSRAKSSLKTILERENINEEL